MPRDSFNHASLADDSNWDNLQRDRFELLSAYLDGEVTPAERQQVLQWLETDQTMQCLYARLLKLRRGLQAMPIPPSEISVEETLSKVQARIHRRRPRRPVAMWGGTAIAAMFISAVMGGLTVPGALNWIGLGDQPVSDQPIEPIGDDTAGTEPLTPSGESTPISTDSLMITIEEPVVPIPLAIEPLKTPQSADASPEFDGLTPIEEDGEAPDETAPGLL